MAAPSFMLDAPEGDEAPADDMGEMPMAPEGDPREAAAKAVMSALKSGNALKFADALDEFLLVGDSEMEPDGDEMPLEEAAPPSEDMPF